VKYGWDADRMDLETPDLTLQGHTDTITGLSLSPDGNHLLSNAMDSQLRVWDVRPFSAGGASSTESRVRKFLCMHDVSSHFIRMPITLPVSQENIHIFLNLY